MIQLTLVALYGEKPEPLRHFINQWQERLSSVLGASFHPYDARQVHATVVGLESVAGAAGMNANFLRLRGRAVRMNLNSFLESLRRCPSFPVHIQVGGYSDRDYPFTSRAQRPYQRSFSIQGDKIVVVGWPVSGSAWDRYPNTLDALRRGAQDFGILHAYHAAEGDVDNDFFFRLGTVEAGTLSSAQPDEIEAALRRVLSDAPPLLIPISLSDLRLAAYEDNRLPVETTRTCAVTDIEKACAFVESLNR